MAHSNLRTMGLSSSYSLLENQAPRAYGAHKPFVYYWLVPNTTIAPNEQLPQLSSRVAHLAMKFGSSLYGMQYQSRRLWFAWNPALPSAVGRRVEDFRNAKIQHNDARAAAIISGQQHLTRNRIWIKQAVARGDGSGPVRICRNARTSVEQGVAVKVVPHGNVERGSRISDEKRAEAQTPLGRDRPADCDLAP